MKQKKILPTKQVLAAAALITVFVFGFAAGSRNERENATSKKTLNNPQERKVSESSLPDKDKWKEYGFENFSLRLPSEWVSRKSDESSKVVYSFLSSENEKGTAEIFKLRVVEEGTRDDLKSLKALFLGGEERTSITEDPFSLDNSPALFYTLPDEFVILALHPEKPLSYKVVLEAGFREDRKLVEEVLSLFEFEVKEDPHFDWQTFENEGLGVSLKYPPSWNPPRIMEEGHTFNDYFEPTYAPILLEERRMSSFDAYERELEERGFENISSESVSFNGLHAMKYEIELDSSSQETSYMVPFSESSYLFLFFRTFPGDEESGKKDLYNQTVQTLSFE